MMSIEDYIWRHFWMLTPIGCGYSYVHTTGWLLFTVLYYAVVYTWLIANMAVLAYTNVLIKDRVFVLSQSGHVMIVGAVSMTASVTLSLSRKKIGSFRQLICDPESLSPYVKSEYFDGLQKETTRKKNHYIKLWAVMYGLCGLVGICQPLIDTLANAKFDEPVINGVWTNLPYPMWAPFDLENNLKAWFLVLSCEGIYMVFAAVLVTCATVLCFHASDCILDQLKLCLWAILHLDRRAVEMFRQRYPLARIKQMEKEYDQCYYDCVVENVKHHLVIMKEFKKFIDLASFPIAVPFFGGAMLLGMALITATADDDPRIGPKCFAIILATSECLNMYNLCKVGQEYEDISGEIFEALFHAKWYKRSAKCKKAIFLMRCGCTRPLKLTATRFLTLNMPLFSDLVNSAYSLFNLMNAKKI